MEPKIVNREVKTITTLKYDDGSTKTTEDFKAYSGDIELPIYVSGKVEYKDKDGNIDEDKSNEFREILCMSCDDDEEFDELKFEEENFNFDTESESESKDSQC